MRIRIVAAVLTVGLTVLSVRGAHAQGADVPDPGFLDTNGDGIDGDAAHAIFVDRLSGTDGNPGTRAQPKQTITAGIAAALVPPRKDVYVSKGNL